MSRQHFPMGGTAAPDRVGSAPRTLVSRAAGVLALSVAVAGCSPGAADQVTAPVVLGMTASMMPTYSDGNVSLYQVQIAVPLPVRKMTGSDVRAAGAA
ncbi:MAG: hypothetical protein JOZ69_05995, partial [Myxococcales bacterium]|nr:hypothetical protein [Myxococcales bacterium]